MVQQSRLVPCRRVLLKRLNGELYRKYLEQNCIAFRILFGVWDFARRLAPGAWLTSVQRSRCLDSSTEEDLPHGSVTVVKTKGDTGDGRRIVTSGGVVMIFVAYSNEQTRASPFLLIVHDLLSVFPLMNNHIQHCLRDDTTLSNYSSQILRTLLRRSDGGQD